MTLTTVMPTSGQFVAVWIHDGTIWSSVYRRDGNTFTIYNEDLDLFEPTVPFFDTEKAWYLVNAEQLACREVPTLLGR